MFHCHLIGFHCATEIDLQKSFKNQKSKTHDTAGRRRVNRWI